MAQIHGNIPTTYAGTRFRSRLEARWAAFFDLIGWKWDYESLDFNGWIPDFVIENGSKPALVEVKPPEFPDIWHPTTGHTCDLRPVELKIELALGAPKPAELRGDAPYSYEAWDDFHKNRKYDLLIVGRAPYVPKTMELCREKGIKWVTRTDVHSLGYVLCDHLGWSDRFFDLRSCIVVPKWREAGNRVQWKRPA